MLLPRLLTMSVSLLLFSFHEKIAGDTKICYQSNSAVNVVNVSSSGSGYYTDQAHCDATAINGNLSMVDKLANVTSNVIISITSDIPLYTNITLENLENITIDGHYAPTVNCKGIGGIKFVSCCNITIAGIIWERCGSGSISTYPAIGFYNSSNVLIQSCSFHNSTRQAVALINVLGNVTISNCEFTHNIQNGDHGAAVMIYLEAPTQVLYMINACNFSSNGVTKSVIYIYSLANQLLDTLWIKSSVFSDNKGVPIYILHCRLHIEGDMILKQNLATEGGGIFSNNSVLILGNNCNVIFSNNSANTKGGAVILNNSKLNFLGTSVVNFTNNVAKSFGGAIFSMNKSVILFSGMTMVAFQSNKVEVGYGGALHLENCDVFLMKCQL